MEGRKLVDRWAYKEADGLDKSPKTSLVQNYGVEDREPLTPKTVEDCKQGRDVVTRIGFYHEIDVDGLREAHLKVERTLARLFDSRENLAVARFLYQRHWYLKEPSQLLGGDMRGRPWAEHRSVLESKDLTPESAMELVYKELEK